MKRFALIFLCCISFLTTVLAQRNPDFFSIINKGAKISDEEVKMTFPADGEQPYFLFIDHVDIEGQYLVLYEYYLDGPPESSIYLGLFDSSGFPVSHKKLLYCEVDCPDGGYSFAIYDSLIEVTTESIEISDAVYEKYYEQLPDIHKGMAYGQRSLIKGLVADDEKEIIKEKKYFILNKNGLVEFSQPSSVSSNRKYKVASLEILDKEDVQSLSKKELRIMRNEIYAGYGYIFNSPDLNYYFTNQDWYRPITKSLPSLSPIEKINIGLIQKAEARKDKKE